VITYARMKRTVAEYPEPTFEEMLRLCRDFGLVTEVETTVRGVRLRCVNQSFEVSVGEAELLMQGLLLGFFFGHSRDDLSLAEWAE
jgi:hypothetical protein